MACRKAGVQIPKGRIDARSPPPARRCPREGYDYVYEQLGPDVLLINGCGGTDVCSAIVSGCPMLPVYRGEIAGRCLGVDTAAFDLDGHEVVGELGRAGDPAADAVDAGALLGRRGRQPLPGRVLRHVPGRLAPGRLGALLSAQGTCVITGRSDATLNRGGVRMGTSELYAVVEEFDGGRRQPRRAPRGRRRRRRGADAVRRRRRSTTSCASRIAGALRSQLSPRHVPDTIAAVPAIPRTLTGKKLEAPVKRILRGAAADQVASRRVRGPSAIDAFVQFSEGMRRETMTVVQPCVGAAADRQRGRARRQPDPALGDAAGALRGQPRRAAAPLGERGARTACSWPSATATASG